MSLWRYARAKQDLVVLGRVGSGELVCEGVGPRACAGEGITPLKPGPIFILLYYLIIIGILINYELMLYKAMNKILKNVF
jgi:hypothetical protein